MAALDFNAIWTAVATAYGSVTAPTGLRTIKLATAQPANVIGNTPAVVVMPKQGTVVVSSDTRGEHDADVWFLYDRREADQMRYATALQKWLGPLLLATYAASKLGLGSSGVMKAIPLDYDIGVVTFGGVEYEGIRITHRVYTEQSDRLTP